MFKATFVTSMFDSVHILKEVTKKLNLKDRETEFNFFKSYKVDSDEETFRLLEKSIEESDIVFFFLHGGISGFQKFKKLIDKYQGVKPFFIYTSIEDENREFQEKSCISSSVFEKIMAYHQIGGEKNYYSLLKYCGNKFAKKNYQVDDFDFPEWEGIYLKGKILERQNIKNQLKKLEDKFVVGVLFHARHLQKNDLQVVNAFEEELEKLGITPLIVFTNSVEEPSIKAKGLKWSIENLMSYKNKLIPKSIINLISYSQSIFSNPGNGEKFVKESIFEKYEIPIIQGMCTYQSREQWDESNVGLDMMSLVSSVYYPEFDGQIISVTCGTSERISEDQTICVPIKERVNKISRMALNWGTLSVKENKDKKVAIIFHNMPPRNDMIGCAFSLDTPASVFNMIKTLNQEGVHTDYQFKDGDEIIKKIIEGVTIDKRWLTVEKVMEKSIDKISKEKYNIWFKNLNKKASDRMIKNWGEPLGEYMVYDENIPVPGILNGNIFIGLQPPRGYDEKAEEVYHSTDIVIPHQYYSFYKWIKEEFKADIIYHVGTHGTLEWLPGKEIGLSDSCFSDINIDDIPHLYPYAVNVTGEGLQAKRRSNAVVVSHMIPSLTLADSYDSIEEIDSLIKEYYQSLSNGDKKSSIVLEKIKEICFEKKYNLDLKISNREEIEDEKFIKKLHIYIDLLKTSVIKDGLHILGQECQGIEKANLIYSLMRIDTYKIKSMDKLVSQSLGIDIEKLKENQNFENIILMERIRDFSQRLIKEYVVDGRKLADFILETDNKIIHKEYLEKAISYIDSEIIPKLALVNNELRSVAKGLNGKFISPGKSGCPTRGGMDILPTGTNFYSIDPDMIPSRSAWNVAKSLGDDLLKKYLDEEGKYPKSITMVIYGGETMKTNGEDIGEALYLMGVEPVWIENTDRVIGLKVIPYEELQRPRIDTTLRITGLFRDTFPNLINIVESAVNLVSQLNESNEINYIKKNMEEEIKELLVSGIDREEAEKLSTMRVFGCPPGTYGAGVDYLIESQKWDSREDLGNAYIKWSGFAYGKDYHGQEVESTFKKRMEKTDVTLKNEASVEIDMLESDDYFTYHGGLTAAVKSAKGTDAKSYVGDSSDPTRVKTRDLKEEAARIMRARILNPKWIEGLKKHGYKGAQEMSGMMDIVFGWDATSEIIENWMYSDITKTFIQDEDLREWIEENNPHAVMNMTEKLLEANTRKMWEAPKEQLEDLRKIYLKIEGDIEAYEE